MIKKIKKTSFLFFLFIFFIPVSINSQDYERIKNQNTVFVNYKNIKGAELKKLLGSNETSPDNKPYIYQFFRVKPKVETNKLPFMTLYFRVFKNVPKEKELLMFRVHKSFLRKNKKSIMNWEFMQKIGINKTIEILKNAKTILLIDDSQREKNTILVKEVILDLPIIE